MSETILSVPAETALTDARGRKIVVRRVGFRDRHRLLRNLRDVGEAYLAECLMFASVVSIDGVPAPPPDPRRDVEPIIDLLGEDGCEAVQGWFAEQAANPAQTGVDDAKN